jgi:hypothetical protein
MMTPKEKAEHAQQLAKVLAPQDDAGIEGPELSGEPSDFAINLAKDTPPHMLAQVIERGELDPVDIAFLKRKLAMTQYDQSRAKAGVTA